MMENDKLYPRLSEEGEKEAELYLQEFKKKMAKIVEYTISEVYISPLNYIESDSWINFRNELLDGLKNYKNARIHEHYNFVKIRKQIFEENREEIIKDLNQDLIEEVKSLKNTIKIMKEFGR